MSRPLRARQLLWALPLLLCPRAALAQVRPAPGLEAVVFHDTGPVEARGDAPEVVASFLVEYPGAHWLRLGFERAQLAGSPFDASGAWLRLTSVLDGAEQRLDAHSLAQWRNTSAYFNGSAVLVELVATPRTGQSRVVLASATAGLTPDILASQCGPIDDRVASSDPREARLMNIGCTGWLIDDCLRCFLTAGHCTGGSTVAQFNVPPSLSSGTVQHPHPDHQYAIDLASVLSNGGQGTGNDWGYFGVFPNSNTGLTPFQAQQALFPVLGQGVPPFDPGELIRITGYGVDSGVDNQTLQTHAGPWIDSTGNLLRYQADTTGGNSGSPVIHEPSGRAIGIHTHAGCTTSNPPTGGNQGTALHHPALQAALSSPAGVCAFGVRMLEQPVALEPGQPAAVRVEILGEIVPGTALMWSRPTPADPFVASALAPLGGAVWEGTLLARSCAEEPQYYFSVESGSCGTAVHPPDGPSAPFGAPVGSPVPIFVDDFQQALGWTVQNGPGLTTGTWQRAVPGNFGRGDPPADADGSGMCYVTENVANADVDGGTTSLISPVLDLSGGALVTYSWWLNDIPSIPLGAEDSFVVQGSTDGGASWITLRDERTAQASWRTHAIGVGSEIPATATMRFRFQVSDLSPGDVVEGGLDDFRVLRLECGSSGVPFCSGDGSAGACPCGNAGDAGHGCAHSFGGGGLLSSVGSTRTSNDTLRLEAAGLPASTSMVFFQGTERANGGSGELFGDGLLCAGGTVLRLAGRTAVDGTAAIGADSGTSKVSHLGAIPPAGGTRTYQVWFRNTQSFCTPAGFNTTNGLEIVWIP